MKFRSHKCIFFLELWAQLFQENLGTHLSAKKLVRENTAFWYFELKLDE